jgi:2'-5' RNA ligase
MAFIGIKVPHETARLLSEVEVPGTRESPSSFHVTLLFLGSKVPVETLAEALKATLSVTTQTRPFTVSTSRVTAFPKGDDGFPIICPVSSDALHDLQAKLRASYDAAGIEYSKRFPEYKPHVTLSYSEKEVEERRIPTVEWGAHECVLWGGDEGDRRLIMSFPFSIETLPPPIEERVAQRYIAGEVEEGFKPGKFPSWEEVPP